MSVSRFLARLLLGKRLVRTSGTVSVEGAKDDITIRRDKWGIPYIEAKSLHDLAFGIGFCQGQDRTFQLELLHRVVRGTLSEIFGTRTVAVDRLSRRIGFHRAALEQLEVIDDDVRETIEAFAAGIRAGATAGIVRRPHELAILRAQPSKWEAVDSLGVVKLLSFTLPTNWDAELVRYRILIEDGPEAVKALHPSYPEWQATSISPNRKAGKMLDLLTEELDAFQSIAKVGGGSNNWVVAGSKTASGRPLMASDPHLDARIPNHWYLAQMRCPELEVAGGTFVGGPSVLVGHNGHSAWSPTAGFIDNTDMFLEQIGPDGCSVREGDDFVPCEVREETIHVRGKEPVVEKVLITKRGPIVTPAIERVDEAMSMRAVWLDPLPSRGMVTIQRAKSFSAFRKECEKWPGTPQNLLYADVTGTTGWQMIGQAPKRKKGNGYLPRPGWDPEWWWEPDLHSLDENPWAADPPEGFLATANAQPRPEDDGPILSRDWLDGYRLAAIQNGLQQHDEWDVPKTMALQMDRRTFVWDDIRDFVASLKEVDPNNVGYLVDMLLEWDGVASDDSAAATVYELFLITMEQRIAKAKAPKTYELALGKSFSPLNKFGMFAVRRTSHLVQLLRGKPEGWFPHSWEQEATDALHEVDIILTGRLGKQPTNWGWGCNRTLTMYHPMGQSKLLAGIFQRGPFPNGGDSNTINQAASLPLKPLGSTDNLASMRAVIDVGAWSNSRFVMPGGQSGNPYSPHYDDLLSLWLKGEGVPISWTPEEIEAATTETLVLKNG